MKTNHIQITNLTTLEGDEECKTINIRLGGCLVGHLYPGQSFQIKLPVGTQLEVLESSVSHDLKIQAIRDKNTVHSK